MFQRTLILATLFTLLVSTFVFWNHMHLNSADLDAYHCLIKKGARQRSHHALQNHPAIQERTQVQKDFWIPQGAIRNHLRILSKTSQLALKMKSGKIEATEKLQNLEGWVYEQLNTNGDQQVRHFTALEGTYYYPSHRFFARDVELSLFRNPNADLSLSSPFLYGTAEEASFSACRGTSLFKAEHLKATFTPPNAEHKSRRSFCALAPSAHYETLPGQQGTLELFPNCQLTFPDASLKCEGPLTLRLQEDLADTAHPLQYQDAFVRIEAQNGRLTYLSGENPIELQAIYCDGPVRLFSQESYALADQLVYFPETQTLHLFAQSPGRVLFWKSDGSIQISAPEVKASFDHKQQKEEIQGIGDVHFTFNLEEKNRIEILFGKYL